MRTEKLKYGFILGVLPITFLAAVIFWIIGGLGMFKNSSTAIKALEIQGYTDIQITDHAWLLIRFRGCDGKDAARFTATAKNPRGQEVEVYVCTGLVFKGATIRMM